MLDGSVKIARLHAQIAQQGGKVFQAIDDE